MKKRTIVIATVKSWNVENALKFQERFADKYRIIIIRRKEDLNYEVLKKSGPDYVFLPHWSWIIPENIYMGFNCVVFHMTDLPFGRGGSPLQNLILRGINKTKISAIRVGKKVDAGPVFMKKDLCLNGSAEQIYKRASAVIFDRMIPFILKNDPCPEKQQGKSVKFHRRTPEQSRIPPGSGLRKTYDFIRMLDADGYPRAFISINGLRFEFYGARYGTNGVQAKVFITRKDT
jgi:methionyl-tRNA formyltransferase